jgi:1,4-dihydroxy-2-naphthoate octaprenyltransferase
MEPVPSAAAGEPSAAALAGPGAFAAFRRGFLATRPKFYTASVLPVLVGTAWAAAAHDRFDGLLFALAMIATVLAHGATNVYNDVSDDLNGGDPQNALRIHPYTGGSRFIQNGVLSRETMFRLALVLGLAALAIGVWMTALRGAGVMVLGLLGLAIGWLYSKPGIALSGRGIGELAVAVGLGALPAVGATWLQSGVVDGGILLLAACISVWVALILLINEVPDSVADAKVGKRTLVVRLGEGGTRVLYSLLTLASLGAGLALVWRGDLPWWAAIPVVALTAMGLAAQRGITLSPDKRAQLKKSIEMTLAIHSLGCIAFVVAIVF